MLADTANRSDATEPEQGTDLMLLIRHRPPRWPSQLIDAPYGMFVTLWASVVADAPPEESRNGLTILVRPKYFSKKSGYVN